MNGSPFAIFTVSVFNFREHEEEWLPENAE